MRIVTAGYAVFAALLIVFGVQGLVTGDFTALWQPVPKGVPARDALAYVCAVVSLVCGVGLFSRRAAARASRVMFGALILWFLAWRVRALFLVPLIEGTWSCGAMMVMMAAAWVLCAFTTEPDRRGTAGVAGPVGVRIARMVYGLGLLPFGYAHFANLGGTAALVPGWLPWHAAWAYLTGGTFIAASLAIVIDVRARLAARRAPAPAPCTPRCRESIRPGSRESIRSATSSR
jgi:uncharacterized membrane protein YphA (DoxX/SURF4 family)